MELPVEQQEDDQDGDGCGQEQRMTGALSALKLSSVLDAVALGERYLTVQSTLYLLHRTAHIAPRDVCLNHQFALHVLTRDAARPAR